MHSAWSSWWSSRCHLSGSTGQSRWAEGNLRMNTGDKAVGDELQPVPGGLLPLLSSRPWQRRQLPSAAVLFMSFRQAQGTRHPACGRGSRDRRADGPGRLHAGDGAVLGVQSSSSAIPGAYSLRQPAARHSNICKLRACFHRCAKLCLGSDSSARFANAFLGRQSHCLGPTGLPWAARDKEGRRILITLTRLGADQRARSNCKTKEGVGSCAAQVWAPLWGGGIASESCAELKKGKGPLAIPRLGSSYGAQPPYSRRQLSWVYTTALHRLGREAWAGDGHMKATWNGLFEFPVCCCKMWQQITGFKMNK